MKLLVKRLAMTLKAMSKETCHNGVLSKPVQLKAGRQERRG